MILVNIEPIFLEKKILLDLHYATSENVAKNQLYAKSLCYLHEEAWDKLLVAVDLASSLNLKIKIFDGYRPLAVQQYLFDKFIDKPGFVSNPQNGVIPHCRGVALDLTLVDAFTDKEIDMGTGFDDFSQLAFHNCVNLKTECRENRLKLLGIMTLAGFDFYRDEWWHYQLMQPRNFPVINSEELGFKSLV